jgi:hypothetical protein
MYTCEHWDCLAVRGFQAPTVPPCRKPGPRLGRLMSQQEGSGALSQALHSGAAHLGEGTSPLGESCIQVPVDRSRMYTCQQLFVTWSTRGDAASCVSKGGYHLHCASPHMNTHRRLAFLQGAKAEGFLYIPFLRC